MSVPQRVCTQTPAWMDDAACKGATALFFPGVGETAKYYHAIAICHTCPVQRQCANLGRNERFGIWGGTSRNDRLDQQRTVA